MKSSEYRYCYIEKQYLKNDYKKISTETLQRNAQLRKI